MRDAGPKRFKAKPADRLLLGLPSDFDDRDQPFVEVTLQVHGVYYSVVSPVVELEAVCIAIRQKFAKKGQS